MPDLFDQQVNDILARLRLGDQAAAEHLVRLYEPYLRRQVRRRLVPSLQSKLDSVDVVQSVWAKLWGDLPERLAHIRDASHLSAYLTRAARHRLIDRYRRQRAALKHEQPIDSDNCKPEAHEPRPSQTAQAAEVLENVMDRCTPIQGEVVKRRRQGQSVNEIALATGLHPSSVRRILYDLARSLGLQRPGIRSHEELPC